MNIKTYKGEVISLAESFRVVKVTDKGITQIRIVSLAKQNDYILAYEGDDEYVSNAVYGQVVSLMFKIPAASGLDFERMAEEEAVESYYSYLNSKNKSKSAPKREYSGRYKRKY